KVRKANPLTDLIDTEKSYVELLSGIIRKVAAAWSRSNLPPPELDAMFRAVEGVQKANRSLFNRLKEIGATPSNPKALGDLLMRWVEDLDKPYTNYCTKYTCGFDGWEPVASNPRLAGVLSTFSANYAPPPDHPSPQWTLDDLFLLPKHRLRYYKKLYGRLLKSTSPGRSDHRMLTDAMNKFDDLLMIVESRANLRVGVPADAGRASEDDVVIDLRTQSVINDYFRPPDFGAFDLDVPDNGSSSAHDSTERNSEGTAATSVSRESTKTMSMPIKDLEHRLATQRCLDIFTMNPRNVRLQVAPPNLTFTREMRMSTDCTIRFTSRVTGEHKLHREGHIYLLSDLFLVCERMTLQEQKDNAQQGADMWLCYPPLSGKVLRVGEVRDNTIDIAIMRKETLSLEFDSAGSQNLFLKELQDSIEFAMSLPPPSKQPPPPVPPLNPAPLPQSVSAPVSPNQAGSSMSQGSSNYTDSPEGYYSQPLPPQVPPPPPKQGGPPSPRGYGQPSVGQHPQPPYGPQPGQQYQPQPQYPPQGRATPQRQMSNQGGYPAEPSPVNGPNGSLPPPRASSAAPFNTIHKSPSSRSLNGLPPPPPNVPPMPANGFPPNAPYLPQSPPGPPAILRRPLGPAMQINPRAPSIIDQTFAEPSPPNSPIEETPRDVGPVKSTVTASFKCKVFLKQHHAQWKALGSANLKLYHQDPTNIKQLVVEDDKNKVIISTIVLTDGVERVGKTGVAIELSDQGRRTGIVYMLQLRNEKSAGGLFDSFLQGSDR
ncbi:hypothetical protein FISHEDRAFT_22956, partial [Fistulina hepatica ATCC 64428]